MASFHLNTPAKQQQSSSTSSSSSVNNAAPDNARRGTGAMMFLGQTCHWHECHREDFLPFKCSDCTHHFCADHFRPNAHQCAAAAARDAAEDFRVPLCPVCNEPPKNWRRGEDPNIAMERHLSSGQCPALDAQGRLKEGVPYPNAANGQPQKRQKKQNECHFGKCHKIMIVPIRCQDCGADFCPSHRAPVQHSCAKHDANRASAPSSNGPFKTSISTASSAKLQSGGAEALRAARGAFLSKLAPSTSSSSNASSALKKPTAVPATPAQAPAAPTSTSHSSGLFKTKAERRSEAEKASALKALHARHAKGLKLTAEEERKLAEGMAKMRLKGHKTFAVDGTGGDGNKEEKCIIS
ncbi:hypothetical protein OC861_002222 [Tilletia horrida]|nr:hypothetical protein OC861_002222 [Tilletia horrida]